ncbi:MAG TPA: hypothetical protein VJL58_03310 [Pyrinomonadaceae bacterium]|nr:hypothetical protein [Pyrinomonadaceae bacterium]
MKILVFGMVLMFAAFVSAQTTFEINNASKYFDVKVKVAECDEYFCRGKASFSFHRKGAARPYQVIDLPDTLVQLGDKGKPLVNVTMLYDEQSVVNIDDYNFDGMDDVAICDGDNGSYGGPSYRVYLSSRSAGKFVYNAAFSELGQRLGMFTVNKKRKTLETFDKSGCCWHISERYAVVNDRPVKIFEEVEDATLPDDRVKITTKTRVRGQWKTSVKYVRREQ